MRQSDKRRSQWQSYAVISRFLLILWLWQFNTAHNQNKSITTIGRYSATTDTSTWRTEATVQTYIFSSDVNLTLSEFTQQQRLEPFTQVSLWMIRALLSPQQESSLVEICCLPGPYSHYSHSVDYQMSPPVCQEKLLKKLLLLMCLQSFPRRLTNNRAVGQLARNKQPYFN